MGAGLTGGRQHQPRLLGGSAERFSQRWEKGGPPALCRHHCRAFPTGVGEGGTPSSAPSPCCSRPGRNPSDYHAIISLGLWDRNPAAIAASRQVEAKPERVRAGRCGGTGRGPVGPR